MNHIPEIAKLLGVGIGEEIKIGKDDMFVGVYKFEEDGLKTNCLGAWVRSEKAFYDVINGYLEIKKLPFEPKEGEDYYYVFWDKQNVYVLGAFWQGNTLNHTSRKYCGNCFRTEEEAEAHKYEIYKKLTGKEWKNAKRTD